MKLLTCPLNGPRNITEFVYGGELHSMPDPVASSAGDWTEYLFFHDNPAGLVTEWWCHAATSYWFLAERDTVTDEIVRTFPTSHLFVERVEFNQPLATERDQ